jgi:Flp pilus assembly protein TadG
MLFARFLKDRAAGVAPMLAIGLVPLMAAVGAAVDYSRANGARSSMQAALDATALMLAKDAQNSSGTQFDTQGTNYFNSNFVRTDVQNVAITVGTSSPSGGTSLTLSATGSMRTTFLNVMGFQAVPLSVHSAAYSFADGQGCVLSLNPTASGATTGQGNTSVVLTACSLYDNSSSATALSVGGSAAISALSVGVVGGVSGADQIVTQQGIKTGVGPVRDPFINDSFPDFSGCTKQNYTAKKTETISPGIYCGGIGLNANAILTLDPGIYYLDGGDLTVNGGAKITGEGVTLVFTKKSSSTWATASINGNTTVHLTAPKSGPTAGIVMFGDRNMPTGTAFKFNGGVDQYLGGAIYVPKGAVSISGGAATSASCTQVIGDTVTFTGNSSLAINCSSYNTKPFSPTVIKITS